MKKFGLVPVLFITAFAAFSVRTQASPVTVTLTGTYTSTSTFTSFSAPGATITFTFSLPMNIGSSLTVAAVPVTISFGPMSTTVANGVLTFFPANRGGGFNLDVPSFAGNAYEWEFLAPQMFNSSFNLSLGTFTIAPPAGSSASLLLEDGQVVALFAGGSATLSAVTSPVPEPAPLFLLGTGLLGFGIVLRRRTAHP